VPTAPAPSGLAALVARTPADRDRVVDLVRGVSLVAVALGHWLIAIVRPGPDGSVVAASALVEVPALHPVTWLFQVMPLFFLVGGVANLRSWSSAGARGDGYATWLVARLQRLVVPAAVAVAVWCGASVVSAVADVATPAMIALAVQNVTIPLWFLAVYVLVVALAPPMSRLHRRHGSAVPVALVLAALGVDVAHRAGVPLIGWVNFAFVWLTPQQLGFLWADGRLGARRTGVWLAGAGTVALVLLTVVGPYPVSVVGVPGADATNNSPPTVVLLALAVAQLGIVVVLRPQLERLLARPRVWAAVVLLNLRAQTVYLWHMPAMIVVAATLVPAGLTSDSDPGTIAWWFTRPMWLLQLALVLAVLLPALGRLEAAAIRRPRRRAGPATAVVAGVGGLFGFALLASAGVPVPGATQQDGLALAGVATLAVATAALTRAKRGGATT
jgi:hypothetical protein